MKKLVKALSLAMAAILLAAVIPVMALAEDFETFEEYPEDLATGKELVWAMGNEDYASGYDAKGGIGVDLFNFAIGGSAYCCKRDSSVWYEFEVSEKTEVTFIIDYIARTGSNRGLDYSVDDPDGTKRVFLDLTEGDDHLWVSGKFTVDAGKHTFYVYAPSGMDDSTLKSCDVYYVELYGNPAAEEAPAAEEPAETPAVVEAEEAPAEEAPAAEPVEKTVETVETVEEPVVEAPVEEAPAAEATEIAAPQTFDGVVIAAIAAAVSLAGYAVSKKH